MSVKCGIVGLPNVGKSTLFNALSQASIAAENYPFCTIEPNTGVVEVPDPRLAQLADIIRPQRIVPAIVEFVDIAGLVAGASKGEGLGNQFLANIRETGAICHVVRCFHDENVIHVAGRIDPLSDVETIATELALADLASTEKALIRYEKAARGGDKDAKVIVEALKPPRRSSAGPFCSSSSRRMRQRIPCWATSPPGVSWTSPPSPCAPRRRWNPAGWRKASGCIGTPSTGRPRKPRTCCGARSRWSLRRRRRWSITSPPPTGAPTTSAGSERAASRT